MNATSNKASTLGQAPLAGLVGPLRIASWFLRGIALLVVAVFVAVAVTAGQFFAVPLILPAILLALVEALRFAARRTEDGADLKAWLPVLAARALAGSGLSLVGIGLLMVLADWADFWVAPAGTGRPWWLPAPGRARTCGCRWRRPRADADRQHRGQGWPTATAASGGAA